MTTASRHLLCHTRLILRLLGPVLITGPLSASSHQASLYITVQAYNWASVAPQTLIAAEGEASRIFRDAGVTIAWLNCPLSIPGSQPAPICLEPCPEDRLAIRIIPEVPSRYSKTSVGVAFSEVYATIFFPRVDEYAKEGPATHSQILGHAMAHEMGHLLLGLASHARFGLMRGQWTAQDLQSMAMGALLFRPEQSVLIRQELLRRMRGLKNSPGSVGSGSSISGAVSQAASPSP